MGCVDGLAETSTRIFNLEDADDMVAEGKRVRGDLEVVLVAFDVGDVDVVVFAGTLVLDVDCEREWRLLVRLVIAAKTGARGGRDKPLGDRSG